jgi:hypothetical protein
MYTERNATLEDVKDIYQNLREADLKECLVGGDDAYEVLEESFKLSSECYVMCHEDVPFAIYGVSPDHLGGAAIWMMGTDDIRTHKVYFMRTAKAALDGWCTFYNRLYNLVYTKNELHVKWIERMGFSMGPVVVYRGEQFRSFELCAQ